MEKDKISSFIKSRKSDLYVPSTGKVFLMLRLC